MGAGVAVAGGGALVAAAFALRIPFLNVPLTADEGGYAEVARLWAHGASLYRSDWVDRPQGLVLAFRAALAGGATSLLQLRLVAAAAGAALVVLVFAIGATFGGRRLGLWAAALAATAGASPYVEGFTLAGELLASLLASASILLVLVHRRRPRLVFLVLAGVAAGCAVMVKQSAFDAAAATLFVLATERRSGRCRELAVFALAAAAPVATAAAGSGNPAAWYQAVVGYGAHASTTQPLLKSLALAAAAIPPFALALGPAFVLAFVGWREAPTLLRAWPVAAFVGVCVGGAFHAHYFLQLVAPLSVLAALGARRLGRRAWPAVAVAAVAAVAAAAPLYALSSRAQAAEIWPADTHLLTDAAVAAYVRAHTLPWQPICVIWAAADVYYLADRRPAYPYLWLRNLQSIPGALAGADRVLSARRPALVVEAQKPQIIDPSGRTSAILRRDYRTVDEVEGVPILAPRARR